MTKLEDKAVIVIFGNSSHGKTTLASMLWKHLHVVRGGKPVDYDPIKLMGFADPVKEVAKALVGMPDHVAYGDQQTRLDWERYGKNAREWQQWVGTELGRDMINPDLWVDRFTDRAERGLADIYIGADGRFLNERDGVRSWANSKHVAHFLILIRRPDIPVAWDHPSETEVAKMGPEEEEFSHYVENTGDLEALDARALEIAEEINAACPRRR